MKVAHRVESRRSAGVFRRPRGAKRRDAELAKAELSAKQKHSARSVCAAAVLGVAVSCARLAGAQDNEDVLQSSLPIQVAVGIVPPPNNQSAFSASNDYMTIFWEPLNLDNLAYDPAPATVVVRLCWAKADISDRPWRKFKNPADED